MYACRIAGIVERGYVVVYLGFAIHGISYRRVVTEPNQRLGETLCNLAAYPRVDILLTNNVNLHYKSALKRI
jgi:hypothetical protein